MVPNTAAISTAVLLSNLLVTLREIELFVKILTADHKYSLCNAENLQQSIKMQSFKKQKVLFELCASILKSTSSFEHFFKKDEAPLAYVFLKKWTPKDVLRILQNKGLASEHASKVNMLKDPKQS